MIRDFRVGSEILEIPVDEVESALKKLPNAKEIRSYSSDGYEWEVPIEKVSGFLQDHPEAKPVYEYPAQIRSFKVGDEILDIPEEEVDPALQKLPDAVEIRSYELVTRFLISQRKRWIPLFKNFRTLWKSAAMKRMTPRLMSRFPR
jgi:hypothetical protein